MPRPRGIFAKFADTRGDFLLIAPHQKRASSSLENEAALSMLPFSPEQCNTLKRLRHSISDILDEADLQALKDRFEKASEIEAYNAFCEKMDPTEFAYAIQDIRSKGCALPVYHICFELF